MISVLSLLFNANQLPRIKKKYLYRWAGVWTDSIEL